MTNASFLPEDYLDERAERRTNLISLVLFGVVMITVFAAFLVTNREWTQVRAAQEAINSQYQLAARKIDELTELEQQREQMLNKAELAAALVERVPRSILLAELINRMPPRLSLLEFELKSEKVRAPRKLPNTRRVGRQSGPKRAPTREQAAAEQQKIDVPRQVVMISMVGVAPTDVEVSRFISALTSYSLLSNVTLDYSEEREMEGRMMRRFAIKMTLANNADVRRAEALHKPQDIRNPMTDEPQLASPDWKKTASVGNAANRGD